MHFKVENTGKGTRYVPTLAGRATVEPGEKNARKLDLNPDVARQYAAMGQRGKMSIRVSGLDDESRAELSKPPQPRQRNRMPPGSSTRDVFKAPLREQPKQEEGGVKSPYDFGAGEEFDPPKDNKAKEELLSRADEMELDDLRTEAQMVLGDAWPKKGGNKLSRAKIKSLLSE